MLPGCDKDGKECLSCGLDNYISAVAISCFGDGMDIFFPSLHSSNEKEKVASSLFYICTIRDESGSLGALQVPSGVCQPCPCVRFTHL